MIDDSNSWAIHDINLQALLLAHTDSDEKALSSALESDDWFYTSESKNTIDYASMPYGSETVSIVPHRRFVTIPKHRHNYVELMYVCKGKITHIIDGKEILLKAGDILMMNQYTDHEVCMAQEEDLAINLILQARFFDDTYRLMAEQNVLSEFLIELLRKDVNCNKYLHFNTFDHMPISHLIELMLYDFYARQQQIEQFTIPNNEGINKNLAFLLFYYLSKDLNSLNYGTPLNYEQILAQMVGRYIDENYQTATLRELACILNQSESALSRQIKTTTTMTFKELLQTKRFSRALKLLEETNLVVSDIALAVGYENSSYFYRRFREIYHTSPKEFRNSFRL